MNHPNLKSSLAKALMKLQVESVRKLKANFDDPAIDRVHRGKTYRSVDAEIVHLKSMLQNIIHGAIPVEGDKNHLISSLVLRDAKRLLRRLK